MFTISFPLETNLIVDFAGIMGLQPVAFFIILFIIAFGLLYLYNLLNDKMKHDRNLKRVTMVNANGSKTLRMNGIFVTATGYSYERLCDVDMHEVAIKGDKNLKKASGILMAPNVSTQRIPQYYIHTKFVQTIMWPKNARETQQVSISQAIYRENISLPGFSYEEMTETDRMEMTAKLSGISADQNVANAVVTEIQQKFDAFTKAVKELKNVKLILLLVFINIIVGAAGALMSFQAYNLINAMKAFFGAK